MCQRLIRYLKLYCKTYYEISRKFSVTQIHIKVGGFPRVRVSTSNSSSTCANLSPQAKIFFFPKKEGEPPNRCGPYILLSTKNHKVYIKALYWIPKTLLTSFFCKMNSITFKHMSCPRLSGRYLHPPGCKWTRSKNRLFSLSLIITVTGFIHKKNTVSCGSLD